MRDPKRIPRILKELEKEWKKNPDLRFMQFIGNVYRGGSYYIEDEAFIQDVIDFYKEEK